MATDKIYEIRNIGVFNPVAKGVEKLSWGEVGFITASIKQISDAKVGDTVTTIKNDSKIALQGFKDIKPMVFCGLYPIDSNFYENLKESLEREFNLALITTSPTVVYEVIKTNKETLKIDNPKLLPDKSQIDSIKEPYVN